jgi:hypothetical protein
LQFVLEDEDIHVPESYTEVTETKEPVHVFEDITKVLLETPLPLIAAESEPAVVRPPGPTSQMQPIEAPGDPDRIDPEPLVYFNTSQVVPQSKELDLLEQSVIMQESVRNAEHVAEPSTLHEDTSLYKPDPVEIVTSIAVTPEAVRHKPELHVAAEENELHLVAKDEVIAMNTEDLAPAPIIIRGEEKPVDVHPSNSPERAVPPVLPVAAEQPMKETLTNVIKFYAAESSGEPISAEINIQRGEEVVPLQIVRTDRKITLGAVKKKSGEDYVTSAENEIAPITTAAELGAVFATLDSILELSLPDAETGLVNPENRESAAPDVEVVVSDGMLEFLDILQEFSSIPVNPETLKEEGETERTVHFVTSGEVQQELAIQEGQLVDMQILFSILEGTEADDNIQVASEMHPDLEPDTVGGELMILLAAVTEQKFIAAEAGNREVPVQEVKLTVSEETMTIIEQSINLIGAFERLKEGTTEEKVPVENVGDDVDLQQQLTVISGVKEVMIDLQTLELIMKLHHKKRQLQQENTGIQTANDVSTEGEKTIVHSGDPLGYELDSVMTAIQDDAEASEKKLEVSAAVMEFLINGSKLSESLEQQRPGTSVNENQEPERSNHYVTLTYGEQEITLDLQTMKTLLKLHKKKYQLRKISVEEGAPEEMQQNTMPIQGGKMQQLPVSYQTLSLLMTLIDNQRRYYYGNKYEFFPQPILHA